jgi:hypothetical protein
MGNTNTSPSTFGFVHFAWKKLSPKVSMKTFAHNFLAKFENKESEDGYNGDLVKAIHTWLDNKHFAKHPPRATPAYIVETRAAARRSKRGSKSVNKQKKKEAAKNTQEYDD